jgi:predicted O-linked N-acetylglucosamine transferase (SPINDLY family)
MDEHVVAVWSHVLRAIPDSRLVLMEPTFTGQAWALAAFEQNGVGADRLEFLDYRPRLDYLATYRTIDICLDTFPYNGHTTSLDALWMGVPVVTLVGDTVVGRAGLCHATALDLMELVARTEDDYVAIAVNLARDVDRLAALRASLRDRMQKSCLMDAPRFAKNLEAAYRRAWRRFCRRAA